MLQTNRQTNKHTDSKILSTPTDIVSMGSNNTTSCVAITM